MTATPTSCSALRLVPRLASGETSGSGTVRDVPGSRSTPTDGGAAASIEVLLVRRVRWRLLRPAAVSKAKGRPTAREVLWCCFAGGTFLAGFVRVGADGVATRLVGLVDSTLVALFVRLFLLSLCRDMASPRGGNRRLLSRATRPNWQQDRQPPEIYGFLACFRKTLLPLSCRTSSMSASVHTRRPVGGTKPGKNATWCVCTRTCSGTYARGELGEALALGFADGQAREASAAWAPSILGPSAGHGGVPLL
jgi:hypothetical protein